MDSVTFPSLTNFMTYLLIISWSFLPNFIVVVNGELPNTHHNINIKQILPRDTCSSHKGSTKYSERRLKLVHRHGPCSPTSINKQTQFSHEQILDSDSSRVQYLHHRTNPTTIPQKLSNPERPSLQTSNIPAHKGTSYDTGNYLVTIGIGTPKKDQVVVFDTGSDITWIQCKPCVGYCYQQSDPIFDPSQSSTYSNLSCSSSFCSQLDVYSCDSGSCVYGVQYGDSSYTIGFYSQDTLTLTPTDVIPSFRFGCGEKNDGLFGEAAGLLGLGRQKESFLSQTYRQYGGVFSYCLPSASSSAGYLNFGSGALAANVQWTPMLSVASTPTFYYLGLTGIVVGGKKLAVPAAVFAKGGAIIDSGTVISRLPPTAYSALRSAFRAAMAGYKTAPALSILDTCYDFSGQSSVSVPTVTLLFDGGAAVKVDPTGILYIASESQACLGFAANGDDGDLGIIGNTQQRKLNVVYDVSKKIIGFGAGNC